MASMVGVVIPRSQLTRKEACAPDCLSEGPHPSLWIKLGAVLGFSSLGPKEGSPGEVPATQSGGHWVFHSSLQSELLGG